MKVLKACRIVENKEYTNLENITYFKDTELKENTNIVKNLISPCGVQIHLLPDGPDWPTGKQL